MKTPLVTCLLTLLLNTIFTPHLPGKPFARALEDLQNPAYAEWIAPPQAEKVGLFLFRRQFDLSAIPPSFTIHLSADPRYRLFVNGEWVAFGPAAGEYYHWNYETIDIAPYLRRGPNVIGVEVRQAGSNNGVREISIRTAMILQGPLDNGVPLITDEKWKVFRSPGWEPLPMNRAIAGGGYIAGATEQWDAARHPWGWKEATFDDSLWPQAVQLGKGVEVPLSTWRLTPWRLAPRQLPLLATTSVPAGKIRRYTVDGEPQDTPENFPLSIPAETTATLLIDQETLDMGFPRLQINGGDGSRIQVRYQESLFHETGRKGHRDEVVGKEMRGIYDLFYPNGNRHTFEPFWLRCFRYVEVTVETADQPLTLENLDFRRTRYPFTVEGRFRASQDSLTDILDASWRTLELCALETYMDCPYYEQIQYIGDTRIQALISLYMTGDDRLMRNAIRQFHYSREPIGLTRSSYPVSDPVAQIIPPFSLLYIGMVHDYFLYRDDPDFIRPLLSGIHYTLDWFLQRLDERGILGPLPYWNHTDGGVPEFVIGSPPGATEGGSMQLSLMLAIALGEAANLCDAFGQDDQAGDYRRQAAQIRAAVHSYGWDEQKGLFAETEAKVMFTQHTNALAILAGAVSQKEASRIAEKLVEDPNLVQATLYFQFYVFEALFRAGHGDLILPQLQRWQAMLDVGLTTFPEHGPESRSDAHAWAAHPLFHLLASTAGIRPAKHGFTEVEISPSPGNLDKFEAVVCHPRGLIKLSLQKQPNQTWLAEIQLPETVEGKFHWKDRVYPLKQRQQKLRLPH